jgi:aryl-alcohol dehydrogenase-like predicted oxidoreductase
MEIGFGLYRFREGNSDLLTKFIRRGGRILDAAPNYSRGDAHALIAKCDGVRAEAKKLTVWSKIGYQRTAATLKKQIEAGIIGPHEIVENHALNPRLIRCQLRETKAELLGIELDAVYLHNPERQLLRLPRKEFWMLMAECVRELEEACNVGNIRRWGISVWDGLDVMTGNKRAAFSISEWENMARDVVGLSHHFELVQMPLNLARTGALSELVHKDSGVIKEAAILGKILVASSPMHGGALPPVLDNQFTELFGPAVSPGQACLLMLASVPNISACLISPRNEEQLNDSLAALQSPVLNRESLCRLLHLLIL